MPNDDRGEVLQLQGKGGVDRLWPTQMEQSISFVPSPAHLPTALRRQ
jgi:hypothetical protein